MESEGDYTLTKVEVTLHEFNKKSINEFLSENGIELKGESWERKIKLLLLVIEENAQKRGK